MRGHSSFPNEGKKNTRLLPSIRVSLVPLYETWGIGVLTSGPQTRVRGGYPDGTESEGGPTVGKSTLQRSGFPEIYETPEESVRLGPQGTEPPVPCETVFDTPKIFSRGLGP